MRPYNLEITAEDRRHLDRLPEKIYAAVMAFLFESLAINPRRVGKPLVDEFYALWSARRAEYRVIYQIDDDRNLVTIHRIAHRGDAYRRR